MPLPTGVDAVTLNAGTNGLTNPDGTATAGTVTLTPSVDRVVSSAYGLIVLGPVNATLSASGTFTLGPVLATDAADFTPTGWTYRVDENFTGQPPRSYSLSLPAAAPTVALPDVAPTSSSSGTVVSPSVLSVNGDTGTVTLDAAGVGAPPTSRQITAGTGLSGGGTLAADRALNVTYGASASTACEGNDSRLTGARTPTAHAASHAAAGSDPVTLSQSQVSGLTAGLAALAPLAGAEFTGAVTVSGADLSVLGTGKGYRFRRGGGSLDLEATGADLIVSNWSGSSFDGTQRSYFRLSADAQNVQVVGNVEVVGALYGAAVHRLDPVTGVASLGGKNGLTGIRLAGFKATAGAPATGTWATGDVVLDSAGAWHLCTAGGAPGTWS